MIGFLLAILAGSLMAIQGVFNTRLKESSSIWVSNMFVHATGLIFCIILWFFTGRQSLEKILHVNNKFYYLGGILGALIVFAVIKSISSMGPTVAIMIFLNAQLLTAYFIELFGWFNTKAVPFEWKNLIAIGLMSGGVILFKM